ncbi:unnamed protein product, partial [Prorocentrum cordatum]
MKLVVPHGLICRGLDGRLSAFEVGVQKYWDQGDLTRDIMVDWLQKPWGAAAQRVQGARATAEAPTEVETKEKQAMGIRSSWGSGRTRRRSRRSLLVPGSIGDAGNCGIDKRQSRRRLGSRCLQKQETLRESCRLRSQKEELEEARKLADQKKVQDMVRKPGWWGEPARANRAPPKVWVGVRPTEMAYSDGSSWPLVVSTK